MAEGKMLSVIVPVYNVETKLLDECFESILDQSFSDYELIVIDDGAKAPLASYIDSYDYRGADVTIIHQENAGVASARNKGLERASGKYVTFIDSDDTIDRQCFEGIVGYAEENDIEVLMFGIYKDNGRTKTPFLPYSCDIAHFSDKQKEEVMLKCLVGILPFYVCPPATADAAGSACAKLYRRDLLSRKDLKYTPGLKRAEDMEFNLRVFDAAASIGNLHRFYYDYRQIATSATYSYRPGGIEVFTASLQAIRKNLISSGKSKLFMQVYYMRCMFFFLESMDMDYLNPANDKPFGVRIRELAGVASTQPYAEAFANLKTDDLTFARKIPLFLIRHKMFTVLAAFYTVYGMAGKIIGKQ